MVVANSPSPGHSGAGAGPAPRIAVLGAGPIGLESALAALDHGFPVTVFEAGATPAANVRSWGHVNLFSPWSMNVSERMRLHLAAAGRPLEVDGDGYHTGHEYADRVLAPLWDLPELRGGLHLGTTVEAVGRAGTLKHEEIGTPERGRRPFRILVKGPDGRERVEQADLVLDCTGKWSHPNTLGDGGIPAPGERFLESRIRRGIPDLSREAGTWRGKTILLVGAGHSAQTAARDLAELAEGTGATRIVWVIRKDEPGWGAVPDDPLPHRRQLTDDARALAGGASPALEARRGWVVEGLEAANGGMRIRLRNGEGGSGAEEGVKVDRILSLTGGVGDHRIYRQLQVHECYATSGPMKLAAALLGAESEDCLDQGGHGAEALVNPEPGFFLLGDKSYGRNSTFLLRTGFQQVEDVFGVLDR